MEKNRNPFEMTEEFHAVFDPRKPEVPTPFSHADASFRTGFKAEELVEFLYASADNDLDLFEAQVAQLHQSIETAKQKVLGKKRRVKDPLVEEVDALTDVLYLTYGSFSLLGVDPSRIIEIVHKANMGKRFPDGQPRYAPVTNKVMKPADWEEKHAPEPKIKAELQRQTEEKRKSYEPRRPGE